MNRENRVPDGDYDTIMTFLATAQTFKALTVELLIRTGARQNEVVRMVPRDFNAATNVVSVPNSKRSNSRRVPVEPAFMMRLQIAVEAMRRAKCTWGQLLTDGRSVATQTRIVRRLFPEVISAALGIPEETVQDRVSTHGLRHTFAIRLLKFYRAQRDPEGLLKVQLAMGHKSIASTVKYLMYLQSEDIAADILKSVG
jgi:integrase